MMFIHLSAIEDEYNICDLVNGIIEITHFIEIKKGYIYKNADNGNLYICYNNINTYLGRQG